MCSNSPPISFPSFCPLVSIPTVTAPEVSASRLSFWRFHGRTFLVCAASGKCRATGPGAVSTLGNSAWHRHVTVFQSHDKLPTKLLVRFSKQRQLLCHEAVQWTQKQGYQQGDNLYKHFWLKDTETRDFCIHFGRKHFNEKNIFPDPTISCV